MLGHTTRTETTIGHYTRFLIKEKRLYDSHSQQHPYDNSYNITRASSLKGLIQTQNRRNGQKNLDLKKLNTIKKMKRVSLGSND